MIGCRVNRTALVSMLLLLPVSARADVIWLQNGHRIEGRVEGEDAHSVVLELPEGTLRIPRSQIELVEITSGSEPLLEIARKRLAKGGAASVLRFLRREYRKAPGEGPLLPLFRQALATRSNEHLDAGEETHARHLYQELATLPGGATGYSSLGDRLAWRSAGLARRQRDVRKAIQSGDVRDASRALEDLVSCYPTELPQWSAQLITLAIEAGAQDLAERNLTGARNRFERALALDLSSLEKTREALALCAVLETCGALPPQRAMRLAPQIADARDLLPREPALIVAEARIREAVGDISSSADFWKQIKDLAGDPVNPGALISDLEARAQFALDGSEGGGSPTPEAGIVERQSEHFIIEGGDPDTVSTLLIHLEHHLQLIARALFGEGTHPLDGTQVQVRIHPPGVDFSSLFPGPGPSDARLEIDRRYGIVLGERLHMVEGTEALESVGAPRELARLVLSRWLGHGLSLPPWIEEGLCRHLSSSVQALSDKEVLRQGEALGVEISLVELFSTSVMNDESIESQRWRAASSSLISFIQQRLTSGEMHRFVRMVVHDGELSALSKALGFDSLGELQRHWSLWRQRQLENSGGGSTSVD